jgi:peptide chain release factor 2
VSEWPKVQLSKSCVGESPPWVQIPPSPPEKISHSDRSDLMDASELRSKVIGLKTDLLELFESLGISELAREIESLEQLASDPNLWSDSAKAKKVTTALALAKSRLSSYQELAASVSDLEAMAEMSAQGDDEEFAAEAASEMERVSRLIEKLEEETYLAGEFDANGAILTIRSGAGGDDATDFAEMLMRMYLRYSEKEGLRAKVLDSSFAEGAGIKSAVIEVEGSFAFGKLSVENGTHRLVRMSPFNAAGKRQTSFAAVEVVPLIETSDEISIPDSDLRVDVFRSSGPGGQSVNTTDSAVRITHLPTGIVVSCQNEKSQLQNKQAALRVLQSRLLEIRRQEEDAAKRKISGDVKASWGEQMRSYVLAPYQMVKDLRTNYEVNNPQAVFDGDLGGFISAGIRWRASQKA